MRELWSVSHVCFEESPLLIRSRICCSIACIRLQGIVVVVGPLGKVVGKFKSSGVRSCVLEINDNELFVLVLGLQ